MARLHRGVGGEHATLPHRMQVVRERAFGAGRRLGITAQERQGEQRRVTLVEVVGGDLKTERPKQSFPADAEDDFLLQTQRGVASVKAAGDPAVRRIILGHVRVEQQDLHRATRRTLQHVQPGADPDRTLLNRHRHHGGQGSSPALRVPRIGHVTLVARRVEFLPEIAGPADQGDEHDRRLKIRCRPGGIAGEDAEPAAISRHLRPDRDFHREIGDPGPGYEAIIGDAVSWLWVPAGQRLVHRLTVPVCR
jgi:hypothetical protein